MRLIHLKSILVPAAVIVSASCPASTWNTFTSAFNEETALFFFDADTVSKQGDSVALWVKYVNTKVPDSDGSWSTASRYIIVCSKRTAQILSSSIYDRDGKFMKSYPRPGKAEEIVPDSILEAIHAAACSADFPKNKSGKQYFPVSDNDIFEHTRRYLELRESQRDQAPK
jgi:hypothetical protein